MVCKLHPATLAIDQIVKNCALIEQALNASESERIARSGRTAAMLDLEGPFAAGAGAFL